jgi:hypothetical protein
VFDKLRQTRPLSRVHMYVFFVADIFVVELVRRDPLLVVGGAEERDEIALEVVAELVDELARVFTDDLHLAHVRLGLYVAFEAVGVAALLLADFAPPPQPLEALRLHLVADPFRAADFCFAHGVCT